VAAAEGVEDAAGGDGFADEGAEGLERGGVFSRARASRAVAEAK